MNRETAVKFTQQSIDIHRANPELWMYSTWVRRYRGRTRWCILAGAAALYLKAEGHAVTVSSIISVGTDIGRCLLGTICWPIEFSEPLTAKPAIEYLVKYVPELK